MKATRKVINIRIEYGDYQNAVDALENILASVKLGRKYYDRRKFNTAIMEYAITNAEPDEYEVRIIDGKPCLIFQSKLND